MKGENEMSIPTGGISEDRNVIDGTAVVARQAAVLSLPISPGKKFTSKIVDELLLANERTVYQCNGGAAGELCNYWNENPVSVTSHTKIHAPRAQLRARDAELAELRADHERLAAELEERKRRRSEASRQGHETRKQRTNGAQPDDEFEPRSAAEATRRAGRTRAVTASPKIGETDRAVGDLKTDIATTLADLDHVRVNLERVADALQNLHRRVGELPAVDPAVVEKAAAYDALKNLMNK